MVFVILLLDCSHFALEWRTLYFHWQCYCFKWSKHLCSVPWFKHSLCYDSNNWIELQVMFSFFSGCTAVQRTAATQKASALRIRSSSSAGAVLPLVLSPWQRVVIFSSTGQTPTLWGTQWRFWRVTAAPGAASPTCPGPWTPASAGPSPRTVIVQPALIIKHTGSPKMIE